MSTEDALSALLDKHGIAYAHDFRAELVPTPDGGPCCVYIHEVADDDHVTRVCGETWELAVIAAAEMVRKPAEEG